MGEVVHYEPVRKRHNRNLLIAGGSAVVLAAASLATWFAVRDTEPPELCQSNRSVSDRFPGDTDPSVTAESRTWRLGVVILSGMPADTGNFVDRRVGYRNPDAPGDVWHDSKPITQRGGLTIMTKVGPGPVEFSVYTENLVGSPNCAVAPSTTYEAPAPIDAVNHANQHLVLPSWP
ncbi:MAG TPA: hypothetical protein VLI54_06950 [Bacillota bacterium]|nr:hypothetical protein [Bacillota bacterium]